MLRNLLLLFALASPILALTQYNNCTGSPNNLPLIDSEPQLVDSVPNGMKYLIQAPDNTTALTIVALNGSWYDIGFAYGQLMKAEINDILPGTIAYMVNQTDLWLDSIKANMPFYLKWIPNLLTLSTHDLLLALLGLQHDFTAHYTPQRFTDQLKGIAAGAGVDQDLLTKVNLIPELIRASCSMTGVWGPASIDTKLVQLRALDWDYQAYLARYPTAAIYFPEEAGSNNFATFGFAGFVGAISGYSTKNAISEKYWYPPSKDPKSELGEPFAYILRDILQFGQDLQSSVDIVFNASRTCNIHVGIGSKADNSFEGLRINFDTVEIYNDKNFTNYTAAHPQMDGIMFWNKDLVQPSDDPCFGSILQGNYGKIDAEVLYRQAAPIHQTGDTMVVVYDFENETVYYAGSDPVAGIQAYLRPLVKLNMAELLTRENIF